MVPPNHRPSRREFCHFTAAAIAAAAPAFSHVRAVESKPSPADRLLRGKTFGISEWQNHYRGDEPGIDTPDIIDECVEVHRKAGLDGIIWNAGRATILYHSDLPHTTRQFELGFVPKPQRVSCQYVIEVLRQCCPLRRAIRLGHQTGMPILGRLSMNRFYGTPPSIDSTSKFYRDHPEWVETGKLGEPIVHKMCYAIPGVQQERMDILLEIQRIGVDALVLDFCRQVPILSYHPAIVGAYRKKSGKDPLVIDSEHPEDYTEWFQFRANILTNFMRRLRAEVRRQEEKLGRACPIVVRVPDYAPWLMVACGIDIESWFGEDLVDASLLSSFPRVGDAMKSHAEFHVRAAHRHGKLCIGGVGSIGLQLPGQLALPDAKVNLACLVADRQYAAGIDGMSLYQSESLCRKTYLADMIRHLGDRDWIAKVASKTTSPAFDDPDFLVGKDWHSAPGSEGLGTKRFGNNAL